MILLPIFTYCQSKNVRSIMEEKNRLFGGDLMKEQLLKVMERNQLIDLMYIAKSGEVTKRRIKVMNVTDESFSAYCFLKHNMRTFMIQSILALLPVIRKEREVI